MNTDVRIVPSTDDIEISESWALWPDFAVRSAGFPVEGLGRFGPNEDEALAEVARDPLFREAVAWQSRPSLRRSVDKLAGGAAGSASRRRRWVDVTAAYWQRYCSKNDTIGYFGPLSWGRFAGEGPAVRMSSGDLQHERVVHFETWAIEAVARAHGITTPMPMCPFPERALRPLLGDASALDRLEAARDAAVEASGDDVAPALDALDRLFEEITGRPATRTDEDSGGGRTIAYLDCQRELDLTLGAPVIGELRASLPVVLDASRWWCGRVFDRGAAQLDRITAGYAGPLAPMLGSLLGAGFALWNQLGDDQRELQRRWASVVSGQRTSHDAFADWTPAWHGATSHSADLQIAARSPEAIEQGDFLIVLGDFHGGGNPLAQGLFGLRHPDPAAFMMRVARNGGPGVHLSPPRRGVVPMTARGWPMYAAGDAVVMSGGEPAPAGTTRIALEDLTVANGHVDDRSGSLHVPIADLLWLPIFISSLRSFDPVGPAEERAQIGRLVVRRASRSAAARELPTSPQGFAAWARDTGLPRRVFVRSPVERKPRYVDFESASLLRQLTRFVAAATRQAPDAPVQFTEMLPGPEDCWLQTAAGHHTSELRIVAVDRTEHRTGDHISSRSDR